MFRSTILRKKRLRRSLWLAAMAAVLLLQACSSGGPADKVTAEGASPSAAGETEAPLEVSIQTITPSTPPAADDNVIKRAIEAATNSKLTINWVSNNVYTEKLNVTLSSGKLPDLLMVNDPFSPAFRTAVAQGAFWDITPYIADYPNLSGGISANAWEVTKQADGLSYGIPRPRPEEGESFFIIRKDWLDKLGLPVPKTTEELYEAAKAFTDQDPDGNGKADTTGFAAYLDANDANIGPVLGAVESSFAGANGNWKWDGEQLTFVPLLPEVKDSLEYLAKAYAEGLLPQDLLSLKLTDSRDLFKSGKAGIIVDKTGTLHVYTDDLKKVDPAFQYGDFYPITSIDGYNPKGTGFNGILAIAKSVPEEKMKRILKLVDTWMKPEVFELQKYGIEGTHYKVKNGRKVVDNEKRKADNASDFNQIVNVVDVDWDTTAATQEETEANELFKQVQEAQKETSVADLAVGLQSETANDILPDLNKKMQDLKAKIILGNLPIDAWDDFVEQLKQDPQIAKMTEEINEAYKARAAGQ